MSFEMTIISAYSVPDVVIVITFVPNVVIVITSVPPALQNDGQ